MRNAQVCVGSAFTWRSDAVSIKRKFTWLQKLGYDDQYLLCSAVIKIASWEKAEKSFFATGPARDGIFHLFMAKPTDDMIFS